MASIRGRWLHSLLLATALSAPGTLASGAEEIPPQTTLKIAVVQFVPSQGNYRTWDALGGEYVVGADGTVILPSLGQVVVGSDGPEALASKISDALQKKLGLVVRPDTTVQVVGYPPIYVVGGVNAPGEYPYRRGMTVLHAVAISGGETRASGKDAADDTIMLRAGLQKSANGILRTTARIARLEAELKGEDHITFPPELDPKVASVAEVMLQETTIFQARLNELGRQTAALKELGELYDAEVKVLAEKVTALDDQAQKASAELERVTGLVKDGMATVSRQQDVESKVNNLRWDRLDNMVATMRAREGLSGAQRDVARLEDDRRTEVSGALQDQQATLEQFQLDQATTLAQIKKVEGLPTMLASEAAATTVSYSILRQQDGQAAEIPADESTALLPGDLVKVKISIDAAASTQAEIRSTALAAN